MKVKGLRWYIIALVTVSTIINFIDRSALNVLWPYIYAEFGIKDAESKSALAYITSFFLFAYAIGQFSYGKIMDKVGTRIGFVLAITGWSIAIGLHALSKSIGSFSLYRALLGFNEAGNWPGAAKNNAEWFPAKERAFAQGIFNAGSSLGTVIAAPLIALLYMSFGWRISFILIAVMGFLWIIPWLWINKATPKTHPWILDEERDFILKGNISNIIEEKDILTSKQLIAQKAVWGIILTRFLFDPIWWLFVTWLPTLLKQQFQFEINDIASFSWFPFLCAAIGGVTGGWFSGYLIKKGVDVVRARKIAISTGSFMIFFSLLAIIGLIIIARLEAHLLMYMISVTLFGFQFLIGNIQTLPGDYFHSKNVGTVAGYGGIAAVVGTVITTIAVPFLTQENYLNFFIMAAMLIPLAMISSQVLFSVKSK